jgi:chromate reductase
MIKINILSGTDRPDSTSMKISEFIYPKLKGYGAQSDIISLRDFPIKDIAGGRYGDKIPSIQEFNKKVLNCDGLIMIIPEYNGGFPGILKLFIDYLPFPKAFNKLPIAFIGEADGAFGALRPVEQMQMVCNYRNAYLFPERVFIQRVNKTFNPTEGFDNEMTGKLLESLLKNFVAFTDRNKGERERGAGTE